MTGACETSIGRRSCTVLLTDDFVALVVGAKAMCLALGGTADACQTEAVIPVEP